MRLPRVRFTVRRMMVAVAVLALPLGAERTWRRCSYCRERAGHHANQEKGDKGPEAWKPPNRTIWCDYAIRWVDIKASYHLSVNQQEEAALEQMLGTCKGG